MDKEEEILEELKGIENKNVAFDLLNYYNKMVNVKNDMVKCLDLLDKFDETHNEKDKKKIRKLMLDNFNEVPRSTQYLISSVIQDFNKNEEE